MIDWQVDRSLFKSDELKVIDLLAQAWNIYINLESQHPMEQQEFCDAIHRAQDLVLVRASRKKIKIIAGPSQHLERG